MRTFFYFFLVVLGYCLGASVIYTIDTVHMRKQAIANECGHYDYHTGEFSWNVNQSVQTIEGALSLTEEYNHGCRGEQCPTLFPPPARSSSNSKPGSQPAPVAKTKY